MTVWNETIRGDPPQRTVTIAGGRRRRRRRLHHPMNAFSSLTNRIFFATALLAVAVDRRRDLHRQRRGDTRRRRTSCSAASRRPARSSSEYRALLFDHFAREARLVADLPKLKAAVDTNDPATVAPTGTRVSAAARSRPVRHRPTAGALLARLGGGDVPEGALDGQARSRRGRRTAAEMTAFWPEPQRDPAGRRPFPIFDRAANSLGTLIVGVSLDSAPAARFKTADQQRDRVRRSTARFRRRRCRPTRCGPGSRRCSSTRGSPPADAQRRVNTSRSPNRSAPCRYRAAQPTVTRPALADRAAAVPQRLHCAARQHRRRRRPRRHAPQLRDRADRHAAARRHHRDDAGDGGDRRPHAAAFQPPPDGRWQDEDARLLATTFNSMTDSIAAVPARGRRSANGCRRSGASRRSSRTRSAIR